MPSKNVIREYVENGYYHIYNRGVEKRRIFADSADYSKFLYLLKIYLSPIESIRKSDPLLRSYLINNNLADQVELLAYCLMSNHFHLLIRQKSKNAISKLMQQILTSYSLYFNKRYNRVGHLFQGRFRAVLIENDEYLLHLSRYIHLNPQGRGVSPVDFEWSSFPYYLGQRSADWINTKTILDYFSKANITNSYQKFVEDYIPPQDSLEATKPFFLDGQDP